MPGAEPIDLAFAGAGWIAAVHGYAVDHVPGLRISRVASRDPERAAAAAGRVGAEPCTYDELPDGAAGVVVCTPPAQHRDHALHSIAGGASVLIEKPLCTTLAEADELVAAAERGARDRLRREPRPRPDRAPRAGAHRPAPRRRPRSTSARCSRDPAGATSSPMAGAGACCSTSACTRSPSRCCSPRRPCPWRCAPRSREPSDHPVDEHAVVQLHFDTGLLARVVTSWRGDDTPTWDAQVSAPDGVVRFELLPDAAARARRHGGARSQASPRASRGSWRSWGTSPRSSPSPSTSSRTAPPSSARRSAAGSWMSCAPRTRQPARTATG